MTYYYIYILLDYDNDWLNIYNDSSTETCEFNCDTASGSGVDEYTLDASDTGKIEFTGCLNLLCVF